MPDAQWIDIDGALARMRGNKKLYRRMLSMLLDSQEFAALEEALVSGDYPHAADISHAIKGMTGNLSLPRLFAVSAELNQQLKTGAPEPDTLVSYRTAVERTRAEVEILTRQLDEGLI